MADLWAWLAKPKTRSVLAFVGAGVAALATAIWQVWLHLSPAPAPAPAIAINQTQQVTVAPGQAAAPSVDPKAVQGLQDSQKRALQAETNALDDITRQIDASEAPAKPAH